MTGLITRFFPMMAIAGLLLTVIACDRPRSGAEPAGAVGGAGSWHVETRVEEGRLELEVTPGPGLKINDEFPWLLEVAGERHDRDAAHSFDERRVHYVLPIPEGAAGELEGELRFSVCNDATCYTPRETVRWQL